MVMKRMIVEQWASVNYTEFQYASVSIGENWGYQNNIVSDSYPTSSPLRSHKQPAAPKRESMDRPEPC